MTRKSLLKPRHVSTKSRRISFAVSEELAIRADALAEKAGALGFDIDIDSAMTDAYRKFLNRIEQELGEADSTPPTPDGNDQA